MTRDDERLRQGLRGYAAQMAAAHAAPPAQMVWLRAERRRRRAAVEQAERPLRVMQGVGLVCGLLAVAWMAVRWGAFDHPATALGTEMVALGIASAALVAGGCWAMVRMGSRPLS
jgi:hypothetical protein